MASEPIIIFSSRIDLPGIITVLRSMTANIVVKGPENNWSKIILRIALKPFGKPALITFEHNSAYDESPKLAEQIQIMQAHFARFPRNELAPRIMLLIGSFRFAISMNPPPAPDMELGSKDLRLKYLYAVTKHVDGVIFTPSALRDAAGRILCHATMQPDPDAILPTIYAKPPAHDDRSPLAPPQAARVARRAMALAAASARSLLEREDRNGPGVEPMREQLIQWVNAIGISDELEPDEWKLLQHPLGLEPSQDTLNVIWRLEGLGVLAWALQLYDLPPYDQMVSPDKLFPAVGILNAERATAILANPQLRSPKELKTLGAQLLGIHWRLHEFRLRKTPLDFRNFAANAWFESVPMDNIRVIRNDLALGNLPIYDAPPDVVSRCASLALERHRAINWLLGDNPIYSMTSTSTARGTV